MGEWLLRPVVVLPHHKRNLTMNLSDYILRSRDERTSHIDLSTPCDLGSSDRHYRAEAFTFHGVTNDVGNLQEACVHVCHACEHDSGNGNCVNPLHTYIGTAHDNYVDRRNKDGKLTVPQGFWAVYNEPGPTNLPPMTPVEALALSCIKYWIKVVEHKNGSCGEIDSDGRPWTRVSATECAEWIEQFYECPVSPRQCQNALRKLGRTGRITREQRNLHRWSQAYSYSLPDWQHATSVGSVSASPIVPAEVTPVVPTRPAPMVPDRPFKANTSSSTSTKSSSKPVENYVSSGLSSRLETAHASRSLSDIAKLCAQGELAPIVRDADGFIVPPNRA